MTAFNTQDGTGCATLRAIQPIFRLGNPFGRSGAQRAKIGAKAQDDYAKRTANPLGANPSETCYIFFTPQHWPQKEVWATERRAEGVWRDVRVIDGDTLVNWLELYPGVAEWLAVRINRRPEGLRSLGQVWSEWSLPTIPALSQDLIIAERDDQMILRALSRRFGLAVPLAVL